MQAYTHFLIAILVAQYWTNNGLIHLLLHIPIDVLAKATYHPPQPGWTDPVWLIYHSYVLVFSLYILYQYFLTYYYILICSILIDIYDWGVIRGGRKLKKDPTWLEGYEIHPLIDKFRTKFFSWLPDWNEKRYGVVPEAILISLMLIIIYLL